MIEGVKAHDYAITLQLGPGALARESGLSGPFSSPMRWLQLGPGALARERAVRRMANSILALIASIRPGRFGPGEPTAESRAKVREDMLQLGPGALARESTRRRPGLAVLQRLQLGPGALARESREEPQRPRPLTMMLQLGPGALARESNLWLGSSGASSLLQLGPGALARESGWTSLP